MKKIIYLMLTLAAFSLGLTACSDNTDDNLIPEERETTLIIKSIDGQPYANDRTLNYGAGVQKLTVDVESNTRWKVEVVTNEGDDGAWCSSNLISGSKSESFIITLRDNRNKDRNCIVNLYKVTIVNGEEVTAKTPSQSISIHQKTSDVFLNPSSVEPFRATDPRTQPFTIDADDVDWTLSVYYPGTDPIEFVTIIPEADSGMTMVDSKQFTGNGSADFTIQLLDNRTAADRTARLNLSSDIGNYTVEITQLASDYAFDVSPAETQIVGSEGDTIKFGILSLSGWTAETAYDWLVITNKSGNASSTREENPVIVLPNLTGEERTGNVRFTPDNPDYPTITVSIVQRAYRSILNVSPLGNKYVDPAGGTVTYKITSLAEWSVKTGAEWITLPKDKGEATQGEEDYTVTVMPNITSGERTGEITFSPATAGYDDITVKIIQTPFDLTFFPEQESLGIFTTERQSATVKLNSRFNWEMKLPDWVSSATTSGSASDREQTITLTIDRNNSNQNRNGNVTIVPLVTQFANNATIDPKDVGVNSINIPIMQFGGREPAISEPWLAEGFGQTFATVEFNYYSPYYPITEAGVEWKRETETEWHSIKGQITDQTAGTVSINLTGLEPATKYVARGYVIYSDGIKKTGDVSHEFITAGVRPGENDNPTPGT